MAVIGLEYDNYSVSEEENLLSINLTLIYGQLGREVMIALSYVNGSAKSKHCQVNVF